MSSEVVFTALVGILFFQDPTTWRFWTGGLLILICVIAMNRLQAGHAEIPNERHSLSVRNETNR